MDRIYLDNNATTPIDPRVVSTMQDVWLRGPLNPASQHQHGQSARRVLERAREAISIQLDLRLSPPSQEDRLIFTSGGSEANNLVLNSLRQFPQARLIISAIEHPSVTRVAEELALTGVELDVCRVDQQGRLDLDHLRELLQRPATLVSCMSANNETGVIQPLAECSEICWEAKVPLHCDATQSVGKVPLSFGELRLSALTFAAHKFYGPAGSGGLVVRQGLRLAPQVLGGFQQFGLRAGTESVALAVGSEAALRFSLDDQTSQLVRLRKMRDEFEAKLLEAIPDLVIHGARAERLPHVSCVGFPPSDGQAMFVAFDQRGIDCSTGSACASGSPETSPVLLAMGVDEALARRSFRFSFGRFNQDDDGTRAADRIISCFNDLQR